MGYLTFDVASVVTGVPGAARAAATVPSKARIVAIAKDLKGNLVTKVTQVGDDITRGMGASPQLAGATSGSLDAAQRVGPGGVARVRVPPAFAPRLSRLAGDKIPVPQAVLKGLALKLHLAQYCDNWPAVAPFIGQKMKLVKIGAWEIPELPPGYRYAKSQLKGGETVHMAYLPNSTAHWVPRLKVDSQGKWQPEGLTWKADKLNPQVGTLESSHRLAQLSEYSKGFPKVLTGKDESQLHHLLADNVIRRSPFFQWAMERGLFELDGQANIIEVAANPTSLLKANPPGQVPRLAPIPI